MQTSLESASVLNDIKRIVVLLIRPSKYDDDGYVQRYWKGVLPSNSLAVMNALTDDALEQFRQLGIATELYMLEDGLRSQSEQLDGLYNRFPEEGTKLVVCIVAAQTNQFPRTCDLTDRWQRVGATCTVGGFHVSGSISTLLDGVSDKQRSDMPSPKEMPKEITALQQKGVIIFHGEAEDIWKQALLEIVTGQAKSLYRGGMPDFVGAPMPHYQAGYFKNFATPIRTMNVFSGCVFMCSFCTIINVLGRTVRSRNPKEVIDYTRTLCEQNEGRVSFFITDDDFARGPHWREILQGFIDLRKQGYVISFMVEADLACGKLPGFLEMLARAGCSQIFMGVESLDAQTLNEAGKKQNKPKDFEELFRRCHKLGIAVHAAYIIGFPHDNPESIRRNVQKLAEIGADQVSFFILNPLPGSEDHVRALVAGVRMDEDFNRYDSFHSVTDHPNMTSEEWFKSYQEAWRSFYTVPNMVETLKRFESREARLRLLRNFIWYRWSFATERTHPMIAGFYRVRSFADRRPGYNTSYARFLLEETWRHVRYFGRFLSEFYRFQQVFFVTEFSPAITDKTHEFAGKLRGSRDWVRRTFGKTMSREWLNSFWREYGRNRWHLLVNPVAYRWHVKMLPYCITEAVYTVRMFSLALRAFRRARTA